MANQIEELEDAISVKIEQDLKKTAAAFTAAREIQHDNLLADLFSPIKTIFIETIQLFRAGSELLEPEKFQSSLASVLSEASNWSEISSIASTLEYLQQDGENLALAIDGPAYGAATDLLLERAESHVSIFSFDEELYQQNVYYDLWGLNSDSNPLRILRKSDYVDRRGSETVSSVYEADQIIRNRLRNLREKITEKDLSNSVYERINEQIRSIKVSILESDLQSSKLSYDTILRDDFGFRQQRVEVALGRPAEWDVWMRQMLGAYADNVTVEMRARLQQDIQDVIGIVGSDLIDKVDTKIGISASVGGGPAKEIATEVIVNSVGLNSTNTDTPLNEVRRAVSTARAQVNQTPQQMMLSLPGEVSKLLMLTDDLVRFVEQDIADGEGSAPRIISMEERYLTAKPLSQTTPIVIEGENFTAESELIFSDGIETFSPKVPIFDSSGQLRYNIAVGLESATWTVQVRNPGQEPSPPYTFYVVNPSGERSLTGLSIEGEASVRESNSISLDARAYFSDGTDALVSSDQNTDWEENSSSASISNSGRFEAESVSSNREVTVSVEYSSEGVTRSASTIVTILNANSDGGSETRNVIVNGDFENGENSWGPNGFAEIVELDFPNNGDGYAYIGNRNDVAGGFGQFFAIPEDISEAELEFHVNVSSAETTSSEVYDDMNIDLVTSSDQLVSRIATFSNLDSRSAGSYRSYRLDVTDELEDYAGEGLFLAFGGRTDFSNPTIFRIDDVSLEITSPAPFDLEGLAIEGDSAVPSDGFEAYQAFALYSDGSRQLVTPEWSENSSAASIDENGFFQTEEVSSSKMVTVSARYSFNGDTVSAEKEVTIFPTESEPTFQELVINAPGSVEEGDSINLTAEALYSDGSTEDVNPSWSENSSVASISSSGRLSVEEVDSDQVVTIFATETIAGRTQTAEHQLQIVNGEDEPLFTTLEIEGPDAVDEGGFAAYEARARFDDGTTRRVNADWEASGSGGTISQFGALEADYVTADATLTISVSHRIDGIEKSTSASVVIEDQRDERGPGVAVESPSPGSAVPTSNVQITGIATDRGVGHNGVSHVRVNGENVEDALASGGEIVNWEKSISLQSGPNTVTVEAADSEGNTSTATIELFRTGAELRVSATELDDDATGFSDGNGDGDADPGEDIEIAVTLRNDGSEAVTAPQLTVYTDSPYAGFASNELTFQDIPSGESATSQSLDLRISEAAPAGHEVRVFWSADANPSDGVWNGSFFITVDEEDGDGGALPEITLNREGLTHTINVGESLGIDSIQAFNESENSIEFRASIRGGVDWVSVSPASGNLVVDADLSVDYSVESLDEGIHTTDLVLSDASTGRFLGDLPITIFVKSSEGESYVVDSSRLARVGDRRVKGVAKGPSGERFSVGYFRDTESIGGEVLTSNGDYDIFAVLYNEGGGIEWVRQYGGPAEEQVSTCVAHPDGGWVICGEFEETGILGSEVLSSAGEDGDNDIYIARLDPEGQVMWARRMGGARHDFSEAVTVDGDGNIILGGYFKRICTFDGSQDSFEAGGLGFDLVVVKYTANGAFRWATQAGGPNSDELNCITANQAGEIFIGGEFGTRAEFGSTVLEVQGEDDEDVFLAKLNTEGRFIWARRLGEPAREDSRESITFLKVNEAGYLFIGGEFDGPWSFDDASLPAEEGGYVGKLDFDGNFIWLQSVHVDFWAGYIDFEAAVVTDDGGILVGGSYTGNLEFADDSISQEFENTEDYGMLLKFSGLGEEEWAEFFTNSGGSQVLGLEGSSSSELQIWLEVDGDISLPGMKPDEFLSQGVYSLAFERPVPNFQPIADARSYSNGNFEVRFFGSPGRSFRVMKSSDLIEWSATESGTIPKLGWILFAEDIDRDSRRTFYKFETE